MNHWIATNTTDTDSYCLPKIVKRVVTSSLSHIIFTSYALNVCIQHERKHADAGAIRQQHHVQ